METPELSISVGDLIGIPKVTLRGVMDVWHDQVVSGVLATLRDQAATSLVLDIANLSFAGAGGVTSIINVLRTLGPEMSVHIVAPGPSARILQKAELGPSVRVYSTADEMAEHLTPTEEALTSRWLAQGSDDAELPVAA